MGRKGSDHGEHLARLARDPSRWEMEAYGLRRACRVLSEAWLDKSQGADVVFPALLLGGYAIEDYAKARLLEHGKDWRAKGTTSRGSYEKQASNSRRQIRFYSGA
jgi:hypothetical protein